MAVYSLKEVWERDKCRLFLTAEVALKGFNFVHLVPGSRPSDQTDRKWWITDFEFNSILKGLTQQKVKMAERTGLFQVKRRGWSGESPSPASSSPGASQKPRDPRTVAVKLTLTREKPWAGPGSHGGPQHWSSQVLPDLLSQVLTQFCPRYRWWDLENHHPHKRKMTVKMKRFFVSLIIKIQEHFLISSCCVVA